MDLTSARPALAGDPQRDSPSVQNMARLTNLVHSSISRDMREVQASHHLSSLAQQGTVVNSFIDCAFVPRHASAVSPAKSCHAIGASGALMDGEVRCRHLKTPEPEARPQGHWP